MHRWKNALAAFALAVAGLAYSPAFAADEVNVAKGLTQAGAGLAVRGYDVVAYFTEGRPRLGSARYAVVHAGGTYRFASQAHLDAFEANPNEYVPAYGGFCAYGAAKRKKFDGDPLQWKIVNGRLFLNLDADVQKEWLKDVPGYVKDADANWRRIEHVAAGKL